MNYTLEPEHSQLLAIQGHEPFNAEPPSCDLVEFAITPEDLVYCRNHGPVRQFDEDQYSLTIRGGSNGEVKLSMNDLRNSFSTTSIVAVLQVRIYLSCLGNIFSIYLVCRLKEEGDGGYQESEWSSLVRRCNRKLSMGRRTTIGTPQACGNTITPGRLACLL